jgi:hypothetical protein
VQTGRRKRDGSRWTGSRCGWGRRELNPHALSGTRT